MFIQTEATPNPATVKFLPGRAVMPVGTADFRNHDDAARSPLARRIFAIDGVAGVFLGTDFLSVTKEPHADWATLKNGVLMALMDHFMTGEAVIEGEEKSAPSAVSDDPVVAQILELLETRVRPAVARDGGDITFHGFEDGVVFLKMRGACSGCPSASATLKMGIENMLRHYLPEVREVRPVPEDA